MEKTKTCPCGCGLPCKRYDRKADNTFCGFSNFAPDCPRQKRNQRPLGYRRIHSTVDRRRLYWLVKVATPSTYRAEHRIRMEQKLGRTLRRHEHVHHIDGDTLNNAVENLIVVSAADHIRIHHPPIERWSIKYDACTECETMTKPHRGNGLCGACLRRFYIRKDLEYHREQQRQYQQAHKEQRLVYARTARAANPERYAEYARTARARKKAVAS